jgi:hypothetical protein
MTGGGVVVTGPTMIGGRRPGGAGVGLAVGGIPVMTTGGAAPDGGGNSMMGGR